MAEHMSEYMSDHIRGLKLVHMSRHMSDSKNVRTRGSKDVRTQSSFPALMMPEPASEHRVKPHKSPFRVGITRSNVIVCLRFLGEVAHPRQSAAHGQV